MSDQENKIELSEDVTQTASPNSNTTGESNLQEEVTSEKLHEETFEQAINANPNLLQQLKDEMLNELRNEVQVYLSPALNYAAQKEAERIKQEISLLLPAETDLPDLLEKWREANKPFLGHFENNPNAISESVVRFFKASQYDTISQSLSEQKQMSNQFAKTNELRNPIKNEFAGSRLLTGDGKGNGLSTTMQRIFERNTSN